MYSVPPPPPCECDDTEPTRLTEAEFEAEEAAEEDAGDWSGEGVLKLPGRDICFEGGVASAGW